LATLLAAIDAGVDAVDAATSSLAGTTSQPPLSALIAATEHSGRETDLSLTAVNDLEPYWEATRRLYAPFESGLPSPTGRVYKHEIPGGQLSNLRQQAIALGLGEKFEQIEDMYASANAILGNVVKVTPSSKVVGDLALHMVAAGADPEDFAQNPQRYDLPDSVVGLLSGELGDPPGGWPEPFRTKALAGRNRRSSEARLSGEHLRNLTQVPAGATSRVRRSTLNTLLFPGPTRDYLQSLASYGDLSVVPTSEYLYGLRHGAEHEIQIEEGKTLIFGLQAIGEPDGRGIRTVMATINGQFRPVAVRDRSIMVEVAAAEKADPGAPGHVAAPFQGVVTVNVAVGDQVAAGDNVATIEAMKMEASVTAPIAGTVTRVALRGICAFEGGDLILTIG
jgi:pyruvate carboxylase